MAATCGICNDHAPIRALPRNCRGVAAISPPETPRPNVPMTIPLLILAGRYLATALRL
jgi:hypothetical protein